jgi:hypothetical protein
MRGRPSVGNCAAAGYYRDTAGNLQGLVAAQAGGTWQDATQVPGLATLNIRDNAHADLVSCSHAGKCVIAGTYTDTAGHAQVFVTGCPKILGFQAGCRFTLGSTARRCTGPATPATGRDGCTSSSMQPSKITCRYRLGPT